MSPVHKTPVLTFMWPFILDLVQTYKDVFRTTRDCTCLPENLPRTFLIVEDPSFRGGWSSPSLMASSPLSPKAAGQRSTPNTAADCQGPEAASSLLDPETVFNGKSKVCSFDEGPYSLMKRAKALVKGDTMT